VDSLTILRKLNQELRKKVKPEKKEHQTLLTLKSDGLRGEGLWFGKEPGTVGSITPNWKKKKEKRSLEKLRKNSPVKLRKD